MNCPAARFCSFELATGLTKIKVESFTSYKSSLCLEPYPQRLPCVLLSSAQGQEGPGKRCGYRPIP